MSAAKTADEEAKKVRNLFDSNRRRVADQIIARQIRKVADRDIFQALITIKTLKDQLAAANAQFQVLWASFGYILS